MLRLTLILAFLLSGCAPSPTGHGIDPHGIDPQAATDTPEAPTVPGSLLVTYRGHTIPPNADALLTIPGVLHIHHLPNLALTTLQVDPATEPATIAALLTHPEIASVLHDRLVTDRPTNAHLLTTAPAVSVSIPTNPITDSLYNSPQGWAVQQSGGFGQNLPGILAPYNTLPGPWNLSLGAGVRIAILDSGIDATHPDLAPNLALNLSETTPALPTPCDTGSPQDQFGHGTFTASLAAAALGGGELIGVAPRATLLNLKVLQRMPGPTNQCAEGTASGLLTWVLTGIDDAIANHADILSLSLGALIDVTTSDGAGWQSTFNHATTLASQSGIVLVAALGNQSLNLNPATSTLLELPAQARNVLPVQASTNPACAEDPTPNAICRTGPIALASYSNFGDPNAIAAPGGNLPLNSPTGVSGYVRGACTTGVPGQISPCFNLGPAPYVQAIGTSASAPLVAGAAALIRSAHPTWHPAQVISALRSTATPYLNLPAAIALQ